MNLINCWDCPISLSEAIAPFAMLIPVALISAWTTASASSILRLLGRLLFVVAGVVAFFMSTFVLRWGIRSEASDSGVFPNSLTAGILVVMNILLILTAVLGVRQQRVAQ